MKLIERTAMLTLMLCSVLGLTPVSHAEDYTEHQMRNRETARAGLKRERFPDMITRAAEVYKQMLKGKHGEVPNEVLKNARCIAVLPDVLTGALGVGVAHGNGLASCRTSDGSWSQPAAISLREGSIGVQLGVASTDLVIYFQNEKTEKALKEGTVKLGAEMGVVAGKFERSKETSDAGVVVYSHSKGAFAGASISGSRIGKDSDDLADYYGKNVDYLAVLEGRQMPDTIGATNTLTSLFP